MATPSDVVKNFTDGSLTILDGTPITPLSLVLQFMNGDFAWTGTKLDLRETAAYESRGSLKSIRKTTRVYPTFTFTFMFTEWTESTVGVIFDMITGKAATPFAARLSTGRIPGDVTTFDLQFDVEGTDLGDPSDHTVTLQDCEVTDIGPSEGDPNAISISGTMYGEITGDMAFAEG